MDIFDLELYCKILRINLGNNVYKKIYFISNFYNNA